MANKVYFTHAGFAEWYQDAVMSLLVAIGTGGGSDALMVRTTRMLGHDVLVLAEKVVCVYMYEYTYIHTHIHRHTHTHTQTHTYIHIRSAASDSCVLLFYNHVC